MSSEQPLVAIVMGSDSDWETMRHASVTLESLGVPHISRALSAHRTPDALEAFLTEFVAEGVKVVIAGAGGAAHLAGVCAAKADVPVLGVPMDTKSLGGMDSLLSTVQMPAGVPVGTLAIGKAGAINAALLAVQILGLSDERFLNAFRADRRERAERVLASELPPEEG